MMGNAVANQHNVGGHCYALPAWHAECVCRPVLMRTRGCSVAEPRVGIVSATADVAGAIPPGESHTQRLGNSPMLIMEAKHNFNSTEAKTQKMQETKSAASSLTCCPNHKDPERPSTLVIVRMGQPVVSAPDRGVDFSLK
jgi:hypothetical protein